MYSQTTLIGRLTKDPELKPVKINGEDTFVCNFSIATDDRGNTDYHNIVAWRKTAENCGKFLGKGRMVAVIGKNKTRSYDGQDGRKVYVTEVIADDVRFLDSAKTAGQGGQAPQQNYQSQQQSYQPTSAPTGYSQQQPTQQNPYGNYTISDDDLPF